MQRFRHPGAAHAQHQRQKFVRQRNGGASRPVMRHENPAREPRVDMTARVADRGVRGLDQERLDIFKCDSLQPGVICRDRPKRIGRYPATRSGDLDVG